MVEKASLEFRFKKIDETRNYLLDEIEHNNLINEKYKKTCKYQQLMIMFQFLNFLH